MSRKLPKTQPVLELFLESSFDDLPSLTGRSFRSLRASLDSILARLCSRLPSLHLAEDRVQSAGRNASQGARSLGPGLGQGSVPYRLKHPGMNNIVHGDHQHTGNKPHLHVHWTYGILLNVLKHYGDGLQRLNLQHQINIC
jgi:hypothetical protein